MRAFIAVLFDDSQKGDILEYAAPLRAAALRGRWTPGENLHLTLAFLGEVGDAAPAVRCMRAAAGAPFAVSLRGFGRFAGRGGAVCWLGVEPCAPLLALQSRLARELAAAGILPERQERYTPHVTLGRGVRLREDAAPHAPEGQPVICQHVEAIYLMESHRQDGRLCYTPRASVPLAGAGEG